eukprot:TRINITY_DN1754_c0_g1_i1.p1 TRINITY_DN1754_c0_g1~~TRINITY_DN1754_c0_g1_i1.p1  ORF type:complete len:815 (+),score=202.18 TRINITY_DN1754_c0_g1_i1:56-2446(+)
MATPISSPHSYIPLLLLLLTSLLSVAYSEQIPSTSLTCGGTLVGGPVAVTETILPTSGNVRMYFVSDDNKSVFIVNSRTHEVFHSKDEGKSWYPIAELIDNFPVWTIFFTEVETGKDELTHYVYFLTTSSNSVNGDVMWLYKSDTDSFERVSSQIGFDFLFVSPHFLGKVVARRHYRNAQDRATTSFFVTSDAGKTWEHMLDTRSYGAARWSLFAGDHPDRLYAEQLLDSELGISQLVYSDDFFKTILPVPLSQSSYYISGWAIAKKRNRDASADRLVVVTCEDRHCLSSQLHISNDGAKTFETAKFPGKDGGVTEAEDFDVLDVWDDDDYWVSIPTRCFPDSNARCKEFFRSPETPIEFKSYLKDASAFTKYNGADGVFVSNVYTKADGKLISPNLESSFISYNKGSTWEPIEAPLQDSMAQPIDCAVKDGCSLHIHGPTRSHSYSWFYSVPNAPGVMVANGNSGISLSAQYGLSNVYVSVDGGKNFKEIRKGPHVPEIGDHGAVIVLVKEDKVDDTLTYSIDGVHWEDCKFTENPLKMTNVRVSMGWDSRNFIGHGQGKNGTTVVFHMNFEQALSRKCVAADFENWQVPGSQHAECSFGEKKFIKRRKQGGDDPCFIDENEPDYGFQVSATPCECTEEEFECAPCFTRLGRNGPCTLVCPVSAAFLPPGVEQSSICKNGEVTYPTVGGYMKIQQSKCEGGVPLPEGQLRCADIIPGGVLNPGTEGSSMVLIVIVIIAIILLVIAGGVWYLWNNNTSFYNAVSYSLGIEDTEVVSHFDDSDNIQLELDSSDEDSF